MSSSLRKWFPYAIILAGALAAVGCQLLYPGYYHSFVFVEDAVYTHKYITQFMDSFGQGIYYPHWMAESFLGYGSPVFIFYSPLFFLSAAAMALSGIGPVYAVAVLKLLSLYAGSIALYYMLRERHGERTALIAAILYISLPTRLVDIYYINTAAGRFSEAFMPLTLLFAGRLADRPFSRASFTGMAISYAALVLSHIATAFIFTPFLLLFCLSGRNSKANLRTAGILLAGIFTGLLLASALFLPVLLERRFVQIGQLESLSIFKDWRSFIIGPIDSGIKPSVAGLVEILRGTILVESGILALLLFIAARHTGFRLKRSTGFFTGSLFICLFMMSPLSGLLWTYGPGLGSVNFPARFSALYLLFMSPLLGIIVDAIIGWPHRPKFYATILMCIFLLVIVYDAVIIHKCLPPITVADTLRLNDVMEMVEYLPQPVDIRNIKLSEKGYPKISSLNKYTADIERWGYVDRLFTIESAKGVTLRIKTFYFPGWRAWVDGSETPIRTENKSGAMLIDIPPGRHEVSLKFADTPARTWGKAISLVTLALLVFWCLSTPRPVQAP